MSSRVEVSLAGEPAPWSGRAAANCAPTCRDRGGGGCAGTRPAGQPGDQKPMGVRRRCKAASGLDVGKPSMNRASATCSRAVSAAAPPRDPQRRTLPPRRSGVICPPLGNTPWSCRGGQTHRYRLYSSL